MSNTAQPVGEAHREALLAYLRSFFRQNKYMPTIKDMAEGTGMQRTSVVWHLGKLREAKNVDYQDGNMARTLRLR